MDRRDFLKTSASLSTISALHLASGRFSPVFAGNSDFAALPQTEKGSERILVVLRLDGGNDGLNTVLPLDQYANLARARSNILIPESKALRLTASTGLHPAMTGLHNAFQEGKVRILQGVGYPNHNQSHFRSTDIWFSGADSNQVLETGVLGRFLDGQFPNYPIGYPSAEKPHPPSIQIGSTLLTLLQGANTGLGMAISDPSRVYSLPSDGFETVPDTPAGHELSFLRQMAAQTRQYGDAVKAAMAASTTRSSLYPATGNSLANQFNAVARLIAGGLRTRVYVLSIGGFDTHSGQVSQTDPTAGSHADLLRRVSEAIAAFLDDLQLMGQDGRVVGMTVSEFGRRILSNDSLGTDHGLAAPMFLFGKPVRGGIDGVNPTIPEVVTAKDNVGMQFDFRSVYATLLRDWMLVGNQELQRVMLKEHPTLNLIDEVFADRAFDVDFTFRIGHGGASRSGTTFEFDIDEDAMVSLKIFDLRGREVRSLAHGFMTAGPHAAILGERSLQAGRYVARLQVGPVRRQESFDILR